MTLSGRTILVVDDEPEIREILAYEFESLGCTVVAADSGRKALEIIKQTPKVDLIVSDVRMAHGDGFELLDGVRSVIGVFPPIVFVSGFAEVPLWEAFERGAEAWFGKPFDMTLVVKMIEKLTVNESSRWTQSDVAPKKSITVAYESDQDAQSERGFHIGRGGLYLGTLESGITKDMPVSFHLSVKGEAKPRASGIGIVRWIRHTSKENLPAGCGIEFLKLDADIRDEIVAKIRAEALKPFIPMKPRAK